MTSDDSINAKTFHSPCTNAKYVANTDPLLNLLAEVLAVLRRICLVSPYAGAGAGLLEIGRHVTRPNRVVVHIVVIKMTFLLVCSPCLARFPIGTHFLNLLLVVELGVVVSADPSDALPEGKMLGVDCDAMVVMLPAGTDELPATLLFFEIETGCIWEEEKGDKHAHETEPWHDEE